jgi:DNA-directed RNA polymerase subunit RPC12/RpoP
MKNEKAAQASPSADVSESSVDTSSSQVESSSTNVNTDSLDHSQKEEEATGNITIEPPELAASSESVSCREDEMETYVMDVKKTALDVNITELLAVNEVKTVDTNVCEKEVIEGTDREAAANKQRGVVEGNKGQDEALAGPYTESSAEGDESFVLVESKQQIFSRDEEVKAIGAEILFGKRDDGLGVDDWTNLRWMSTSGERQLRFCKVVTRTKESRKGLFRSGEQYARRKLAIYENPNLILLLRSPTSKSEVRNLLDLPDGVALDDEKNVLKSFLVAESVIDPLTCMLRLSQLTTITSVGSNVSDEKESQRRPSCLELVTPTETISLSALSPEQERALSKKQALPGGPAFLQTASLENAIANALYQAHGSHAEPDGIADVAWKHQVVQGTLHSFVISGNNAMLERAIKAAVSVDPSSGESTVHVPSRVIDAQDESGRTALHYACLRRASHAVSLLTQAGASCSIPIHPGGFFPVHLSALVHDDKSLSVILSATHPCRPDPNELDALNRTPAYLAAVEGKLPLGMEHDTDSLGRCLSALEAWGGQLLPNNSLIALRNPVSILASRWACQEVAAVILHNQFRYPAASFEGMSVGASFQYPIHSALITLRKRIQMIRENIENEYLLTDDNDSPESALVGTIRVLLEHGLEANERLEGVTEYFEGASDLIEYTGYAPIQILAVAALDAGSLKDVATTELMQSIAQMVAGSVELLVRCGARITLHLPPAIRPRRTASSCIPKGSNINTWAEEKDRESLKIDSNTLVLLLGGEARLERAKDQWSEIKSVEAPGRTAMSIQIQVSKGSIEDSPAPGGSDELSCAICWKEFGAIMNRRQKCSISMRYVCDECSGKRIVVGKQEYRVSDGQFYLARVDATRQVTDAAAHQKARAAIRAEEVRAARETPSEDDNRESLFGSMLDKAATLVLGEEDAADLTGRQVDGLSSQMNQTRDALNERGEKLNSLGEKTSALADSSAQFAKMAKELERSQKGGLFW